MREATTEYAGGRRMSGRARGLALVALVATAATVATAQTPATRIAGFVDGARFVDLAGDDSVTVEVNLHGALLRAVTRIDPDLARMAGGLESIHAVVLDLDDRVDRERVRATVAELEHDLRERGWVRLAVVRDHGEHVHVLVLNDDERIRGLTVIVVDGGELVFANIAGEIDLAAIVELGHEMHLPGLDALDALEGLGR